MCTWCEAWSNERKEAELRIYRARCRVRCLEANLDRIDYEEFDNLMTRIELARAELRDAIMAKMMLSE